MRSIILDGPDRSAWVLVWFPHLDLPPLFSVLPAFLFSITTIASSCCMPFQVVASLPGRWRLLGGAQQSGASVYLLLLWIFILHNAFVCTTISASAAPGYDSETVQRTIDEWTAV